MNKQKMKSSLADIFKDETPCTETQLHKITAEVEAGRIEKFQVLYPEFTDEYLKQHHKTIYTRIYVRRAVELMKETHSKQDTLKILFDRLDADEKKKSVIKGGRCVPVYARIE